MKSVSQEGELSCWLANQCFILCREVAGVDCVEQNEGTVSISWAVAVIFVAGHNV